MNWCSMIFVVASMIVFFFVKPTIEKREEYQSLNGENQKGTPKQQGEEEESSMLDRIPAKSKYSFSLFSFSFILTVIYNDHFLI